MMSDDELRARIADAHRDDAPPPFAALIARRRRRRAPLVLLPLAAVALLLFWWSRPTPPPAVADVRIELHDPLAFLLQPPDAQILDGVPRFDVHLNDVHLEEGEMQ
jgi:hypothetical protein